MNDPHLWLKSLHIVSATLLFGTGLGTAFHMLMDHLNGDARVIAASARHTVLADWLFTATSGVVQVASGAGLIWLVGYDPLESWLVVTYGLYLLAGGCWLKVVQLQYRMRRHAESAVADGAPLPDAYHRDMRLWFVLGWPAFTALIAVFVLMVFKPDLW